MNQDSAGQAREVTVQREVARVALGGTDGFALAGSGAIREHGIIDRPTEDVDLFTSPDVAAFATAVDRVIDLLWGVASRSSRAAAPPSSRGCTWPLRTGCSWTSIWVWTGGEMSR